jgi:hypothetical protein
METRMFPNQCPFDMVLQNQLPPVNELRPAKPSRDFEVVLHVGHAKTASTWLQDTIFADPDSGFVIPWDNSGGRAITAFFTVNPYQDDATWARSFFEEGLERCAGGPGVPIISQEILCGKPIDRIYTGRYVADRIHAAFPRAKILIGVREQKAIALSLYREYIQLDGVLPLTVFLGTGDEPLGYKPILNEGYLEYDRVVSYYQKLYGRENVHILPMELLQKDPKGYVQSLLQFCQCSGRIERLSKPRRVGYSAVPLTIRRKLNPWVQINPLAPWPSTWGQRAVIKLCRVIDRLTPQTWNAPLERRWKETIERRYEGRFRESNRRLADLTGIDLAALGYEL